MASLAKAIARGNVLPSGMVVADGREVDPTSTVARQAIERVRVKIIEALQRGDQEAAGRLRQQVQDREAAADAWPGMPKPRGKAEMPTGNINFERLKELGFTNDVREAGYITPQGRLIDLSGKREGGPAGTRSYDHREAGGVPGMQEFMAQGNIRMSFGDRTSPVSVDISREPTAAQYSVLRRLFELKRGNAIIDMNDGLGPWRPEAEYYAETTRSSTVTSQDANATKLLGLVRKFYQGVDVSGTVLGTSFMVSGQRTLSNPAGFIYHNTDSSLLPEIVREGLTGGSFGDRPVDFGGDVWLAVSPEDLRGSVQTHQYGGVLAYEPVWDDPVEGAEVCPPIPPERIYLATGRGRIKGRLLDLISRER